MPTIYGENAEITGSLQVDGDIDLGSGDDDIQMDGSDNTFFLDGTNNRVGIGTDSPSYKLDVRASADDTTSQITANFRSEDTDYSRITIDSTANADTQVSFMNNGSTKWSIGNEAGRDAFHITTGFGPFDSAADPVVIAASSGNTQLTNNTYLKGGLYLGSETLTSSDNGGSVSNEVPLTVMSNMTGVLSATLANASFTGQRKIILCTGHNSSYSLTVSVNTASWAGGSGTITLSAAGSYANLVWVNSAWWVIGTFGASFT